MNTYYTILLVLFGKFLNPENSDSDKKKAQLMTVSSINNLQQRRYTHERR